MRVLLVFLLFLIFRENACSFRRVVNGRAAAATQFNGVAAIMRSNGRYVYPVCGGAIIANNVIITAAHCLKYCHPKRINLEKFYVHGGSVNLKHGQLQRIQNITCAENNHDIALIHLNQPFRGNISKIEISTQLTTTSDTCHAVGWGSRQKETSRFLPFKVSCVNNCRLMYTTVKPIDRNLCRSILDKADDESKMKLDGSEFCTLGNDTDTCRGDSGGPLFCGENMLLQGLVSWGIGCAQPGIPSVNVVVPFFLKWIKYTLREWAS